MLDSYKRNINYLRLSVTDLCNLKCKYCMPDGAVKCSHEDVLRIEELTLIVKALTNLGIEKVRLTGGEPLVKKGLITLVSQISPLVKKVSLTTNGTYLAKMAPDLKNAGISTVNISLDTLNADLYKEITCGGNLNDTILGIEKANSLGFDIKLNTVLQRGVNEDSLPELLNFADKNNSLLRYIELMPFASTSNYFEKHYLPATSLIKKYNMQFLEYENNCNYYTYQGQKIGFITPISNKFCYNCNRIRVTSKGMCIPCLHSKMEYDLRPYLSDEALLTKYLAKCIMAKPASHNLEQGDFQTINMSKIGG